MTKVIYSNKDNEIYFECEGHSKYRNEDTGNNDVCVAVSAICCMLIRYVCEKGYSPDICTDGHVKIDIPDKADEMGEVFSAAMLEFKGLQDCYREHIKVY